MEILPEEELVRRLKDFSPIIRDSYLGAITVLNTKNYPDRLVHFSHSLREIIDNLARINISNKRDTLNHDERARRLEEIIDPLGAHHTNFKDQYDKLANFYTKLSNISHHNEITTQDECEQKLSDIESILLKLTTPQTAIISRLDDIIKQEPSKKNAKEMQEFLFRRSSESYLLDNISSNWLPYLKDIGFFDSSKFEDQYTKDSPNFVWIPSRLLLKYAKEKPDEITDIILGCNLGKSSKHSWIIITDFLGCAVVLPESYAEKISQKALDENWYDQTYKHDSKKYADLMTMMFCAKKYDIATKMARNLFRLELSKMSRSRDSAMDIDVKPIIDLYTFEIILSEKIPVMCKHNPLITVELLADALEKSIGMWKDTRPSLDEKTDLSDQWRPAIENHDQNQNYTPTPSSIFLQHLRDCLECMIQNDTNEMKKGLGVLKKKQYYIFRRLEMHIYKKNPDIFKNEIEKILQNYFDNTKVYHEYYELLKTTFGLLSKYSQDEIIIKINKSYESRLERHAPPDSDMNAVKECAMGWKHKWFALIQNHLDSERKKEYDLLAEKFKTDPHPEFLHYISVSFGAPSIVPPFDGKSPEQAFEMIKNHKIDKNGYPTEDAMADAFGEYTEGHYEYCSEHALELKSLDPVFSYKLFYGMSKSVKNKKPINWNNILKLAEYITCSIINKKYPETPMYNPAIEICTMIKEGLDNKTISFDMQERIFAIIQKLVKIGNMFPNSNYSLDGDLDSFTVSLNSIDGKSFDVLRSYAIWYKYNDKSGRFSPDVKQIFDEYINDRKTHTASRHAILGAYLPILYQLDKKWIKGTFDKMFTSKEIKIAFWEAYLYNRVYKDIFEDIHSWYNEFLNGGILHEVKRKNIRERTISHVTLAHIYDLDKTDEIFTRFIGKATDDSIKYCINYLEIIMTNYDGIAPINRDKIRAMLHNDKFLKNAQMHAFLINKIFEKKETINIFLNYLEKTDDYEMNFMYEKFKNLRPYVEDYPLDVAKCIKTMLEHETQNKNLDIPDLKPILEPLHKNQNNDVVKIYLDIIEILTKLGYNKYRDL